MIYNDDADFKIEDNGVLVITQGRNVIRYSPHAWAEVHSRRAASDRRG